MVSAFSKTLSRRSGMAVYRLGCFFDKDSLKLRNYSVIVGQASRALAFGETGRSFVPPGPLYRLVAGGLRPRWDVRTIFPSPLRAFFRDFVQIMN
jgi:hypothetical protein